MTIMITLQIFHFQNDYLYLTNGTLKGKLKKIFISAKYYQEDRSGGVKEWNENLREMTVFMGNPFILTE